MTQSTINHILIKDITSNNCWIIYVQPFAETVLLGSFNMLTIMTAAANLWKSTLSFCFLLSYFELVFHLLQL